MGEIAESGEYVVVTARIVNVETAQTISASSINIEREKIIKETESYIYRKNTYFYIKTGNYNLTGLNFNVYGVGVELLKKLSTNKYISFGLFKNIGENDDYYKKDEYLTTDSGDIYSKEKYTSVFRLYGDLSYRKKIFSLNSRIVLGAGLNILSSKQRYYYASGGSVVSPGLNLPSETEQTYFAPFVKLGLSFEKKISKSLLL